MSNTIHISYKEFYEFLAKRYLSIKKSHYKQSKSSEVQVTFTQLYEHDSQQYLFLSAITNISLPDNLYFPQLKVLYGIPAGLLTDRKEESKKANSKPKEIQIKPSDKLYLYVRRALLFMQVWSIKSREAALAKQNLLLLLENNEKRTLLYEIVETMTRIDDFPQTKPKEVAIDDQLFDYQFIWMGQTIGSKLLNGNRMSDEERGWFVSLGDNSTASVPESMKSCEALIAGYVLALKAYNKGHNDISYIAQLLNESNYSNSPRSMEVFSCTLFFLGLMESRADLYFMTSAAGKLFYATESIAFQLAHNPQAVITDIDGYNEIYEALLHPEQNCIQFYKTKNPGIIDKETFIYDKEEGAYPTKVPLLKRDSVVPFLKENKLVLGYYKTLQDNLFVIADNALYNDLTSVAPNLFYVSEDYVFSGKTSGIKLNTPIYTDSEKVSAYLSSRVGCLVHKIEDLFSSTKDEWVVLTGNYELDHTQKQLLLLSAATTSPKRIYLFNFYEPEKQIDSIDLFESAKQPVQIGGSYKTKKVQKRNIPEQNNGTLQQEVQQMFPAAKVNIISSSVNEENWEMVKLGIGLLQYTQLENCMLIDTRKSGYSTMDYINITRCFRDIIVYDEKQRYLFMNL